MYYYVYDEFVQDQKFERDLALIETRLTDLGISGKIARLALFRDAGELIRDEVRRGAKTVVAIGNDITLRKVIDAVGDSGVAIAVIPLGTTENQISEILGVPVGVAACDVLSARIIEKLDVGVINGERFLNTVVMSQVTSAEIVCDEKYKLTCADNSSIEIRNLALALDDVQAANPIDGKIEIVIRSPKRSWLGKKKISTSVVPIENAYIRADQTLGVTVDGEKFEGNEFSVGVLAGKLSVVTGKERRF